MWLRQQRQERQKSLKPQRKVKEVKTKFVTWQQQTATAEAATSQRHAQIKTLQKAAVEATERRNSLLNYVPGDWDSVPELLVLAVHSQDGKQQ